VSPPEGREEEKKLSKTHPFSWIFYGGACGGAWEKHAATVPAPRNLPQHYSCRFQKALDFLGFIL